jgi:hypothetical protein
MRSSTSLCLATRRRAGGSPAELIIERQGYVLQRNTILLQHRRDRRMTGPRVAYIRRTKRQIPPEAGHVWNRWGQCRFCGIQRQIFYETARPKCTGIKRETKEKRRSALTR